MAKEDAREMRLREPGVDGVRNGLDIGVGLLLAYTFAIAGVELLPGVGLLSSVGASAFAVLILYLIAGGFSN